MIIKYPCTITSRLLPGVRIDNAFISIEYSPIQDERHRVKYTYHIDLTSPDPNERTYSYTKNDLSTGQKSLQIGLGTLLGFLCDSADLFPETVKNWADEHTIQLDDIANLLESESTIIDEQAR